MKAVIFFSLLLLFVVAKPMSKFSLFQDWKKMYNKVYTSNTEEIYRFTIFHENLEYIKELQRNDEHASYGLTQFADLDPYEFRSLYLTLNYNTEQKCNLMNFFHVNNVAAPPENFDWTDKGAVNPVRDQGSCGSCWTFSTVGCLEGQTFLTHGKLLKLAEQQLVDCDKNDHGCHGGLMSQAFDWLEKNGGIMSREDYPYVAKEQDCKFDKEKAIVQVKNHVDIEEGAEDDMVDALYNHGPLSIGLNANHLQYYKGGILDPKICSIKGINHGVTGVGYGVENDVKFWKIKNSWGTEWGEKGYFRIIRGTNKCGLAECTSYAQII